MMTQRKPGDYVVNAELTDTQIQRFVGDCVAAGAKDEGDTDQREYTAFTRVGTVEAYMLNLQEMSDRKNVTNEYKDNDVDKDQRIADLERRVAELEGCPQNFEVNQSHVGCLVMVKNEDDTEWLGPVVLEEVRSRPYPYKAVMAGGWEQAKLYTGPTRPNWIAHDGRGTPDEVREAKKALVQKRSGKVQMTDHLSAWWNHEKIENPNDIVRYTIVQP